MKFREIVDLIKQRYKLDTDYKAIKLMDVSHTRTYQALRRNSIPDDDVIYACEKLLNYPEGYLLVEMQAERTKCPEASKILHKISKQILATTASLFLTLSITLGANINDAHARILKTADLTNIYIMRNYL